MKNICMPRPVDGLGRIVIPAELRKQLGWKQDTPLEIFFDPAQGLIYLRKYGCVFCDSSFDTVQFEGRTVCRACKEALSKL